MEPRSAKRPGWTFLSVLRSGAILLSLLVLNSLLVKTFVDTSALFAEDLRIAPTLQFILPLLLIFVEYSVYDFLRRLVIANRD